jgi:sugar porter (SP) family MFS transporter
MAYVWTISLVAAMGGLLFGYDWVVIGGAKPFFEKFFELSGGRLSGWANSCALLGCLVGSIITGSLSDKFGRKRLLILSAVLFAISSVFTGWAGTFTTFVIWRIIGGIAIGMASNLSPMYIAEVAPAHMRGRLVAINQLTIVIGILGAQIANLMIAQKVPDGATAEFIRQSWNGQFGWRWMFTAVTVPSLLFFVGALFVPESPRWLVKNGMADKARHILGRIGGGLYGEAEVNEIQKTIVAEEVQHVRFRDLLEPRMTRILVVGVVLAVLQQWSGINVIFNYAEELFKAAGYDYNDIMINIALTGAINLVFTSVAIGVVDRAGRKILMLIGCAAIGFFHACIGLAYAMEWKGMAVLVLTLCTLGSYALSLAPITWVLISEIFPNRIRGAAVSVAVSALWIACFILTYTFPILNGVLGAAKTFWLYSAICFAGFVFVWFMVPETKGKTLEQIEKELVD